MTAPKRIAPPPVSPITAKLARYMARAHDRALPAAVTENTKHHLLDTIAAMISGATLPPGRAALSYSRTLGGPREASLFGCRRMTGTITAALANGMLAHADETDDSHAASLTHPGCGVVPAALAVAERAHAGGTALLRSIALGYDVCARITMALDPYEFLRDGHSTHGFGPMFGAAAASASLLQLDERQMRHVLSYTAQQAAGVSCWVRDEEHIEKAFDFGGLPARNGVTSALMVAHGFTGVDDVFSGERNFFAAYGRAPRPDELARGLGRDYEILNTNIKRWSVGSPIQAPLDSLYALIREHGIRAANVDRVVVRVAHHSANTVNNRNMPDICMQHMCAVMLIDGIAGFESAHDERRMHDPRVLAVRRLIELRGDDELQKVVQLRQGIVEVTMKDGRGLRHHTTAVRGTSRNPMPRREVEDKAMDLIAPTLGKKRAAALCAAVWSLDTMKDMRAFGKLHQP